ncbi:MAG: hypothetical protein ACXW1Z_20760 [Methylobacter sp.]
MNREIHLPAGTEYINLDEIPGMIAWALSPYDKSDTDVLSDFAYRMTKRDCRLLIIQKILSGSLVPVNTMTKLPEPLIFAGMEHITNELMQIYDELSPCWCMTAGAFSGLCSEWGLTMVSTEDARSGIERRVLDEPVETEQRKDDRRRDVQVKIICETARALKYDLRNIPFGGKSVLKAECYKKDPLLFSDAAFDHAWKEANKREVIRVHKKESYRGEYSEN